MYYDGVLANLAKLNMIFRKASARGLTSRKFELADGPGADGYRVDWNHLVHLQMARMDAQIEHPFKEVQKADSSDSANQNNPRSHEGGARCCLR